ncbi:hypothetical protein [Allohahella sp. A8]|uniref:hypothetical protein n=1 Tax=Allohahella sp. A8 TaxID=3141461 RepID=UPI003A80FA37
MSQISIEDLLADLKARLDLHVKSLIATESEAVRGKIKELQYLISQYEKPRTAA